ncbi:apolipoprotein N-acyltransferase [Vibrio neptunius]|uniref:apolipoprotein N-acyltransferase n=1 Tax=Vibrio neptunius TaxID=170651 RepID=UPI0019D23A37|nr:apolipoprotein N-acyltransferase [Vibrio neptunius]MBN3575765.1 apolipoprotein N-acyltransferase [Vibrio neptunius]
MNSILRGSLFGGIAGALSAMSYRVDSFGVGVSVAALALAFVVYVNLKTVRSKSALWFLFGLAYYTTSLFWVNGYLAQEYGDASWIRWGLWPLLVIILSSSFLIIPCLLATLTDSRTLVALPFVLVSLDILREHTVFSFAWLHPGLLLLDVGFSGWLSVIGALGGSFLVYLLASSCAWLISNKSSRLKSFALFSTILVSLWVGNQALLLPQLSEQSQSNTSVRILHSNFTGPHKLSKNDVIERMQRYVSLSLQAPKADIVVWPESSMSLPYEEIQPFVKDSLDKLKQKSVVVVWGGQARNGQHLQNVIYRSDQPSPIYFKQRLVPFGEYRPAWFIDWVEQVTLSRGGDIQVASNSIDQHEFGSLRAVLAVCYEALYSDVFTSKLHAGNVAFLLSDVEWTDTPWVKQFLLKLSRVRAAEVGKSVVYATNQGKTSLIGPDGAVLRQVENQATQVMDVLVPLNTRQTLYTQYGHQWLLWLSGGVLLLIHLANRMHPINTYSLNQKRLFRAQ